MKLKHKGAYNELAAIVWLLEQGYEIFRNVSPHGPADLIALRGDERIFIDVKSIIPTTRKFTDEQRSLGIRFLVRKEDGGFFLTDAKEIIPSFICDGCGREVFDTRGRRLDTKRKFCSRHCQAKISNARHRTLRSQGIYAR